MEKQPPLGTRVSRVSHDDGNSGELSHYFLELCFYFLGIQHTQQR